MNCVPPPLPAFSFLDTMQSAGYHSQSLKHLGTRIPTEYEESIFFHSSTKCTFHSDYMKHTAPTTPHWEMFFLPKVKKADFFSRKNWMFRICAGKEGNVVQICTQQRDRTRVAEIGKPLHMESAHSGLSIV